MLLAIDIHYKATYAKCVGVLFNWEDASPKDTIITTVTEVQPYVPGEFYKRELPCVLKVIEQADLNALGDRRKNRKVGARFVECCSRLVRTAALNHEA